MAHDIFISYSSKDKVVADALCATLESRGVRCWVAPRDILPGMDWGEAIVDAISSSRIMVLIFSSSANASPQVRREVERAVFRDVAIVPFRIEATQPSKSLEYFISTPHWLDAIGGSMEQHLRNLVDVILQLLGRADAPAELAPAAPSPAAPTMQSAPELPSVRGRTSIALAVAALALVAIVAGVWIHSRGKHPSAVRISSAPPHAANAAAPEETPALSRLTPTSAPATGPAERRPLISDDFKNPNSGFLSRKTEFSTCGYEDGMYFIETLPHGHVAWRCPGQRLEDFTCQVTGRLSHAHGSWALFLTNVQTKCGLQVSIHGDGTMTVGPNFLSSDESVPGVARFPNAAIKHAGEFNTLRVTVQNEVLQVYVNGVAVVENMPLGTHHVTPGVLALACVSGPASSSRVQFTRYELWSPSLEK